MPQSCKLTLFLRTDGPLAHWNCVLLVCGARVLTGSIMPDSRSSPGATVPDCNRCTGYFITHDPAMPYGCRHMGFRSKRKPCLVVFEASGEQCLRFEPKAARRGRH